MALSGMNLEVLPNQFVGLLGPNGAGKSTLFQIAAGLAAPDGGKVRLFGLDYRHAARAIHAQLGVVFQSRSLDLEMSVAANLKFHGGLFGLSGKTLASRIGDVAELLDITALLSQPVRTLSGGNQRRVEIARALLNRPKLLLLDEPTVGLDPKSRMALLGHMAAIRRHQGTSILWATHLVDELTDADMIFLIAKGKLLHRGTPGQLLAAAEAQSLTQAYVVLTGEGDET
jgi:ABC-2 type transport system ATP-binding protein